MSKQETIKGSHCFMTRETRSRLEILLKAAEERYIKTRLTIGENAGGNHDWHDNFPYEQAIRDSELGYSRLIMIRRQLMDAVILEPRQETGEVGLGNTVIIRFDGEEKNEEFTVLGSSDSLTKDNWIYFMSPLGSALMGRKAGDIVEYAVDSKQFKLTIKEILKGKFE